MRLWRCCAALMLSYCCCCVQAIDSSDNASSINSKYFEACANGDLDGVVAHLKNSPGKVACLLALRCLEGQLGRRFNLSRLSSCFTTAELANSATIDGEYCLHLAAISGKPSLVKTLLQAGADPNVRTTHENGLRMHPLSWHVYGGHVDAVSLLLKHGAHINADFDHDDGIVGPKKVTALDIAQRLRDQDVEGGRFAKIYSILVENGAEKYQITRPL